MVVRCVALVSLVSTLSVVVDQCGSWWSPSVVVVRCVALVSLVSTLTQCGGGPLCGSCQPSLNPHPV